MKIRQGFVTNSSSSSFIICAKKEIDEQYKNWLGKDMTKDNYLQVLVEESWIDTDSFGYTGEKKEDIMKLFGIDEKTYLLMSLLYDGDTDFCQCIEIAQYFEKHPDAVLNSITLEWGYESQNPKMKEFLESAEVVYKE